MKMYNDSILEWMKSERWTQAPKDCGCRGSATKVTGDRQWTMCVGHEIVSGELEAK